MKPLWKEIKDAFWPSYEPWYRKAWTNLVFCMTAPFWVCLYLSVAALTGLVFLATMDKYCALDAWEDLTP